MLSHGYNVEEIEYKQATNPEGQLSGPICLVQELTDGLMDGWSGSGFGLVWFIFLQHCFTSLPPPTIYRA